MDPLWSRIPPIVTRFSNSVFPNTASPVDEAFVPEAPPIRNAPFRFPVPGRSTSSSDFRTFAALRYRFVSPAVPKYIAVSMYGVVKWGLPELSALATSDVVAEGTFCAVWKFRA